MPYPGHWEADVLLRDGHVAHLRPIVAEDQQLLVDFYEQVSAESKYSRFFAPMPHLSDRDLLRFTNVDHQDRVAFVLTVACKIIAVGRFDRMPPEESSSGDVEAEVASSCRTPTRGGASSSCCSSTSPRLAANAASTGSSPTSFRTTAG